MFFTTFHWLDSKPYIDNRIWAYVVIIRRSQEKVQMIHIKNNVLSKSKYLQFEALDLKFYESRILLQLETKMDMKILLSQSAENN